MLHILTIHFSDRWTDIQKRELARFISEPYKVYSILGDGVKRGTTTVNYEKNKHKFDGAIPGAGHWTESMGKLIDYVLKNFKIKPTDKILLLDSDAFPIAPISDFLDEKLKEYPFVSAQEPMHEWNRNPLYKIPHPMFMLFKAKYIIKGDLLYYIRNIIKYKNSNWWGGVIKWLNVHGYEYYPLVRSNKVDLHPLYYGIYDDLLYHHWAGSRNMITAPDRLRHKALKRWRIDEPLDDMAKKNSKMSDQVFERIESIDDIDNMMLYLRGEYEES